MIRQIFLFLVLLVLSIGSGVEKRYTNDENRLDLNRKGGLGR